jgi:tRNA modification GTPase
MLDLQDTIAAIATAPGAAGLAVVRVSGARALVVADALLEGGPLARAAGYTLHHGWALWPDARRSDHGRDESAEGSSDPDHPSFHPAAATDPRGAAAAPGLASSCAAAAAPAPGTRLDEVVAAVFRAPHSYTREDVVEFSCHGGRLSAGRVLAALLAAGARLARPGEFTLRAFLNGRLDLVQAEAVADLIHAETAGAHALALSQLRGDLSQRLGAVAEAVRDAVVEVEARVDFAEDVGGVEVPGHVIEAVAAAELALDGLLAGAAYARAVREGVRVALVGRPNVGKSSLFNALLGERRAIVAAGPGTTRDLVSEAVELAGVRVSLADTAGLRDSVDEVESEGVARAGAALEESAVVVWVVDAAEPLAEEDRRIAARLAGRRVLVALNKCDRPAVVGVDEVVTLLDGSRCERVAVSATRGDGVDEVVAALGRLLGAEGGPAGSPAAPGGISGAVANLRHVEALARARAALGRAREVAAAGAPGEVVALELREALFALGEVTGESVGVDLLERIFSRFCIGK